MSVVNYLKKVQLPNNVEYTVKDPTFFTGTTEEWNLLSTEEKQSYQIVNLTDDEEEGDISEKADKVTGATAGNLAGLDGNGNLTDSGVAASSIENLGTASTYDVPESGDASDDEVVKGDDTRLGNIKGNNTVLTTDKTPFLTRQTLNPTGFSGYVREKLIGASYAWNQLVENGNFADTSNWQSSGVSSFTVSGNVATFTPSERYGNISNTLAVYDNHKYLAIVEVKLASNPSGQDVYGDIRFNEGAKRFGTCTATTNWQTLAGIIYGQARSNGYIRIIDGSTNNWVQIQVRNVRLIDLTLAFGSTIADYLYGLSNNGGITKLRDMGCPIDKYTPYGYGLYSSKPSAKKIVGKNLFNADILLQAEGWTKDSNGVYSGPTNTPYGIWKLANGGFPDIYFEPNKRYVFTCTGRVSVANKWMAFEYQYSDGTTSRKTFGNTTDATVTFVSDASKTVVAFGTIYGDVATCYMSNIQLEQGTSATTYEPYCGYEISLGNDELRGKFDLVNGEIVASGDVKESNGNITHNYQRFNLGDYNWQESEDGAYYVDGITLIKGSGNNGIAANMMCANYVVVPYSIIVNSSTRTNKTIALQGNGARLFVYDTAYSDPTTFKTAMNGVYLDAELATPTTEQSTPFADPMSMVGATTEEYIDTRDIPCPVGAERQYMGESDDIIPIPSSPMSDGKRVLTSYKSGNEEQLVWEGLIKKKVYTVTTDANGQAQFYEDIDGIIVGVESSDFYTLRNSSVRATYKYIKLYNDSGEPLANTTRTIVFYIMDF